MANYQPHAAYVVLLWCRACGHLATRPVEPHIALVEIQRRARCAGCSGRDIGARIAYEPKLNDGFGLHIWELRLIARACLDAAQRARETCASLPYSPNNRQEQDLRSLIAIYERLASCYLNEARQREALPMHRSPQ